MCILGYAGDVGNFCDVLLLLRSWLYAYVSSFFIFVLASRVSRLSRCFIYHRDSPVCLLRTPLSYSSSLLSLPSVPASFLSLLVCLSGEDHGKETCMFVLHNIPVMMVMLAGLAAKSDGREGRATRCELPTVQSKHIKVPGFGTWTQSFSKSSLAGLVHSSNTTHFMNKTRKRKIHVACV